MEKRKTLSLDHMCDANANVNASDIFLAFVLASALALCLFTRVFPCICAFIYIAPVNQPLDWRQSIFFHLKPSGNAWVEETDCVDCV